MNTPILSALGFTPDQQTLIALYLESHDMTEKQFLKYAAMLYFDRCMSLDDPNEMHNCAGLAPSFCPTETNFKPEIL